MSRQILNAAVILLSIALMSVPGHSSAQTGKASTEGVLEGECQMYGGGVLAVGGGASAVYLFIGDRPLCNNPGLKKSFCAALQTRLGYDTVREFGEQPPPLAIANALDKAERDYLLAQYPPQALEKAIAACGLKHDQVKAKAALDAQANLQAGRMDALGDDLKFLRRELPSAIEPLWKRECAGRVSGTEKCTGGEGRGVCVAFNGKPTYDSFCKRTTAVDKANGPGRFGG